MARTHSLSTNRYGVNSFVVSTTAANGDYTTLAAAMADASVGDTIFLRDSVTENVTITPGVNIASWYGGSLNTPTITGKLTMTGAGTSNISGIRLQTNSDFCLAVTGSAASIVNLVNCFLNFTNNTGISFTSSSSSAVIQCLNCQGDLGTTGIAVHSMSSTGNLAFNRCNFSNSGASTTASSNSAGTVGINWGFFNNAFSTSSTGVVSISYSDVNTSAINTTCLTTAGTGSSLSEDSTYDSGTASAISIGAGTTLLLNKAIIKSSNTNAITGAGTIQYAEMVFRGSSSTINTTTQTALTQRTGITRSYLQPAFQAYLSSSVNNVTGDGTTYTFICDTEVYDQNSNYNNSTGTFTAPVTGKYHFSGICTIGNIGVGHTACQVILNTSNESYFTYSQNPVGVALSGGIRPTFSLLVDMNAGDTATFQVQVSNSTKTIQAVGGARSSGETYFSGYLVC